MYMFVYTKKYMHDLYRAKLVLCCEMHIILLTRLQKVAFLHQN
jgi:hypothetical protein